MAGRGDLSVGRKEETKPEKFEADQIIDIDEEVTLEQPKRQLLQSWLPPLLLGTGLGVAIAVAGSQMLSRLATKSTPVQPAQSQRASMSVAVAAVERTLIARKLNVTGTITARDLSPVLPETTGLQVEQILVKEGDSVKKGQVMAILDNTVLQARIAEAQAEVESNIAAVGQKQAALAQSQASLAEAERVLKRYQQLANAGAISQESLDTRATTAVTAKENVRVAQANIRSAEAEVRSSKANLQQLQTQLQQTQVRAPASGLVAEEIVEVGDITNATQKLFSIIQNGKLELQAKVPAIELPQIRTGAPAQITSDADSRVRFSGKVREIAPLVDAQSRQATVKIDLPSTDLLRPGMFARAAITTTKVPGLTVPAKAVVSQPDGSSTVYLLIQGDKVQAQSVEVGEVLSGGKLEIKNGLKVGDRVIIAGAGYLKDGDRVRIIRNWARLKVRKAFRTRPL